MAGGPSAETFPTPASAGVETSFAVEWLNGMHPVLFTPHTWERGRYTTIRLRSLDDTIKINVARMVATRIDNGHTAMSDELYPIVSGGTEVGEQDVVGQFKYEFTPDGLLIPSSIRQKTNSRVMRIVQDMRRLVEIEGATVISTNYDAGEEANFRSDGTQWVDTITENPITQQELQS